MKYKREQDSYIGNLLDGEKVFLTGYPVSLAKQEKSINGKNVPKKIFKGYRRKYGKKNFKSEKRNHCNDSCIVPFHGGIRFACD